MDWKVQFEQFGQTRTESNKSEENANKGTDA